MEHYVTLFDSLFLPQGLALHASLQRHAGPFTLWVLCVDDAAFTTLQRLNLPHLRPLALAAHETDALREVKSGRSRAEYCWTLTPFTPGFVFAADPGVDRVTYLDADLWLTAHPRPVFQEFERAGKAVLISEHAYAAEYDQTPIAGRFCVQFMTFVRGRGEQVRTWWAQRCIEWCFARLEDGKFGDQMYLNDWPERFADDVHVLGQRGLLQAPWNATRFPHSESCAFHFHGLRLMRDGHVLLTPNYRVPGPTLECVYQPYVADLREATRRLAQAGHLARPQTDVTVRSARRHAWIHRLTGGWRGPRIPVPAKL